MKIIFLTLLCITAILSSCTKEKERGCVQSFQLMVDHAAPTIGTAFQITASDPGDNITYSWYGPDNLSTTTNSNTVNVSSASYRNRGWYYCNRNDMDCSTNFHDSIFIDVQLVQETPPCSLTDGFISCNNIPDVTLTSVTEAFDGTFNGMAVYGYGGMGYPEFTVLFNSYNGNAEPLDGTYVTTDVAAFDITDDFNAVSVSFLYASDYYHCHPNQKLYVTHVNGKIQVSFCDMEFSNGSTPFTVCTGKMTEQ